MIEKLHKGAPTPSPVSRHRSRRRQVPHVEHDEEARSTLTSDTSGPIDEPKSGRMAFKVIDHLGDEVMKVRAR